MVHIRRIIFSLQIKYIESLYVIFRLYCHRLTEKKCKLEIKLIFVKVFDNYIPLDWISLTYVYRIFVLLNTFRVTFLDCDC